MKKIFPILFITFICYSVSAQYRPRIQNVAVVETQVDDRSNALELISKAEISELTNDIRRAAVNNLPGSRFNVMTTETVLSMGDAVLQECAEENCVISLGSKIGADYIVRGVISTFQRNLSLTVEIFETEYGMLIATAAPVRSDNLNELLEKTTPAAITMYKSFMERIDETAQVKAARQAEREAEAVREAQAEREAQAKAQDDSRLSTATPNTPAPTEPKPDIGISPKEKKKSSPLLLTVRWSSAALVVGGIAGGIFFDGKAKSENERYFETAGWNKAQDVKKSAEDAASTRDLFYIIGAIGLSGFTLTLFF